MAGSEGDGIVVVDQTALAAELRAIATGAGLAAVGFASTEPFAEARVALEERKNAGLHGGMKFTYRNPARSTDPDRTMAGARTLVVAAYRYLRQEPPVDRTRPQGRVARYAWSDYYRELRGALTQVAERLRAEGYRAMVLADDNSLVDRAAAVRAGIGWYGNNTTVLLPGAGSWYVLGAVLTDAPLPADGPTSEGGCGTCRRCLPACPTDAIVAPGVLDARRCLAWLVQAPGILPREYRAAVGDRIYGCDDCQDVCPFNRRGERKDPPAPAPAGAMASVDVLELLAMEDEEIIGRWGRWYIAERNPAYLRRNALVVLGNTATPGDPAARRAIERVLAGADAMLRAHAVWAAARLGLTDLVAGAAGDPSADVRAEVAAAPAARPARPESGAEDETGRGNQPGPAEKQAASREGGQDEWPDTAKTWKAEAANPNSGRGGTRT